MHSSVIDNNSEILSVSGLSKHYGGVHALDGVDLVVRRGEIHAVLGENGAGKTTLVKIITGVVIADSGTIRLDSEVYAPSTPRDAWNAGIAVVHQELSLIPQLSVAHNLSLSRLPTRAGLVAIKEAITVARNALAVLKLDDIDPRTIVGDLSLAQQQMVEVAKAMMMAPKIVILDEATSSLGSTEVEVLFQLLHELRDQGTAVVIITHRLREVWQHADSMTILRDGRTIGRSAVKEISQREAVTLMAGRDIRLLFPPKTSKSEESIRLQVRDVVLRQGGSPWSLDFYSGEILGLGGLEGQGQREFLLWLFGSGTGQGIVFSEGSRLTIHRPSDALNHGIVLVPEERKIEGLHLGLPIRWNLAMATLDRRSRWGFIKMREESLFAAQAIKEMAIKVASPFLPVSALSGGSQQKVVIAKFLARNPSVILFLDVTRGIDVETKYAFYEMLRSLSMSGTSCVVYSSDTQELVGLCDRVAVFHDGAPVRVLEGEDVTEDAVVAASFAVGGKAI